MESSAADIEEKLLERAMQLRNLLNEAPHKVLKETNEILLLSTPLDLKKVNLYCYIALGILYMDTGNLLLSYEWTLKAERVAKEIENKQVEAAMINNSALILQSMNKNDEALAKFQEALDLNIENNFDFYIPANYKNMANIYRRQHQYELAIDCLNKAIEYSIKENNVEWLASSYSSMGNVFLTMINFEEALSYYFKGLDIAVAENLLHQKVRIHGAIGKTYLQKSTFDEAEKHLLLALELDTEQVYEADRTSVLMDLVQLYKNTERPLLALNLLEEINEKQTKNHSEELNGSMERMKLFFESEQKVKEAEIYRIKNIELNEKNEIIEKEKERSEALLLNILPSEIAVELKEKGFAEAKLFDEVSVLFTDFVGFSTISELLQPQELVDELHICFSAFDEITHRHQIEKIKTVGDAYLAISGLPTANPDHAINMVKAAKEIAEFMMKRKLEKGDKTFDIRIGIHSGSVVAGIVGVKKFAYDIWGDTVNIAARMEQNSIPGKINISESTFHLVKDRYTCEFRGEIEAKNKGKLKMYFVS